MKLGILFPVSCLAFWLCISSFETERALLQDPGFIVNLQPTSWSGQLSGKDGEEYSPCVFPIEGAEDACLGDLVCVPVVSFPDESAELEDLSLNEDMSLFDIGFQQRGMCVSFPSSSFAYIFLQNSGVPFPVAYFPLEDGSLASWPFAMFGSQDTAVETMQDAVFGEVIDCNETRSLRVESVDSASADAWSIAFWFKLRSQKGNATLFAQGENQAMGSFLRIYIDRDLGRLRVELRDNRGSEVEFAFYDSGAKKEVDQEGIEKDIWHFASLVGLPREGDYHLFLDGVPVAESQPRVSQQTSNRTQLLTLENQVKLCSKNFVGSISHLLLFDSVLTTDQINILYSQYFTSKQQLLSSAINNKCSFPALFRGALVEDCVLLDGSWKCPSSPGHWSYCSSFKDSQIFTTNYSKKPEIRYSESGKQCASKAYYDGRIVFGCILLNGVETCHVGDGVWEKCSSSTDPPPPSASNQTVRKTIHGQDCVFPFKYKGEDHMDCVFDWSGSWVCQISTGELFPCGVQKRNLPTGHQILPRLTISNEECFFPLWFENQSLAECLMIDGVSTCLTPGGPPHECKKARLTLEGYQCAIPFPYENQMYSDCVSINGTEFCRTGDGIMRICAPLESTLDESLLPNNTQLTKLPGRITVSGDLCHFPFWNGLSLVTTCVQLSPEDPREVCRNTRGEWEECYPERETIDGQLCALPFTLDDEGHYDCVRGENGFYICPTVDGSFHLCDLSDGVPLFPTPVSSEPEMEEEDGLEELLEES